MTRPNERKVVQPEATAFVHTFGLSRKTTDAFYAPQTGKLSTPTDKAAPDMFCIVNGKGFVVEVKAGGTSFPFADLRPEQRQWIETWAYGDGPPEAYQEGRYRAGRCIAWVWLCMGTHPPNYDPEKYKPRRTWLIPWRSWGTLEEAAQAEVTRAGQPIKSFPYSWLHEHGKDFELLWQAGGGWGIRKEHQWTQMYL